MQEIPLAESGPTSIDQSIQILSETFQIINRIGWEALRTSIQGVSQYEAIRLLRMMGVSLMTAYCLSKSLKEENS